MEVHCWVQLVKELREKKKGHYRIVIGSNTEALPGSPTMNAVDPQEGEGGRGGDRAHLSKKGRDRGTARERRKTPRSDSKVPVERVNL